MKTSVEVNLFCEDPECDEMISGMPMDNAEQSLADAKIEAKAAGWGEAEGKWWCDDHIQLHEAKKEVLDRDALERRANNLEGALREIAMAINELEVDGTDTGNCWNTLSALRDKANDAIGA